MKVDALITKFREAVIAKGDGSEVGARDSDLFEVMSETYDEMEQVGTDAMASFVKLLDDESLFVKSWVASQLLYNGEISAEKPIEVLKEISSKNDTLGFSALMVLEQYENGELKSPL